MINTKVVNHCFVRYLGLPGIEVVYSSSLKNIFIVAGEVMPRVLWPTKGLPAFVRAPTRSGWAKKTVTCLQVKVMPNSNCNAKVVASTWQVREHTAGVHLKGVTQEYVNAYSSATHRFGRKLCPYIYIYIYTFFMIRSEDNKSNFRPNRLCPVVQNASQI